VSLGKNTYAVAISAGSNYTCAILGSGAIKCWGANVSQQLGASSSSCTKNTGETSPHCTNPVSVPSIGGSLPAATALATGTSHACALLVDGSVRCWGSDTLGQRGDGGTGTSATSQTTAPSAVNLSAVTTPAGTKATAIGAGTSHTCAVLNNGYLVCWGSSSFRQLGDAESAGPINDCGSAAGSQPCRRVAVLVATAGGEIPTPLQSVVGVAGGAKHTCALLVDGGITCWGANNVGQLGRNSVSNTPVNKPGLSAAALVKISGGTTFDGGVQIAAGGDHTCAVRANGTARCWGANSSGELGNNSTSASSVAVTASI
jgi:alpha-tubulin suppressor-like RCC1 family protein